MNLVSAPVAMMAAVRLYVGPYCLWMFFRRCGDDVTMVIAGNPA